MTLYKLFTDEQGHQVEDKLGCYLRQHRRRPRVLPTVWPIRPNFSRRTACSWFSSTRGGAPVPSRTNRGNRSQLSGAIVTARGCQALIVDTSRRVSTTETRTSTLKSTASNARMGKLRVGHLHTDAEQARALAQALLAATTSMGRWQVTIRSQSLNE
jgi:hypothetical protein